MYVNIIWKMFFLVMQLNCGITVSLSIKGNMLEFHRLYLWMLGQAAITASQTRISQIFRTYKVLLNMNDAFNEDLSYDT